MARRLGTCLTLALVALSACKGGDDNSGWDDARSTLEVTPATLVADGAQLARVVATVRDARGKPLAGQPVVLAASGEPSTLVQAAAETDASGRVEATLASTRAGARTVSATVAGKAMSTRRTVTFTAGAAARMAFAAAPASVIAGEAFEVELQFEDAHANVAAAPAGASIALELDPPGLLEGGDVGPTGQGTLRFSGLRTEQAHASRVLVVSAPGLPTLRSAPFAVRPAAPDAAHSSLELHSAGPHVADGSSEAALTATLRDRYGNAVDGQAVSFAVTGSANTLVASSPVTDAAGSVQARLRSTRAEPKTVSLHVAADVASAALLERPVEFTAGPAARLAFVTPPQDTTADDHLVTLELEVLDAHGNRVLGGAPQVQLLLGRDASASAGELEPQPVATAAASAGIARFEELHVSLASTRYYFVARSDSGVEAAESSRFDVRAGEPYARTSQLVIESPAVEAGVDLGVRVDARDRAGNPVPGAAVSLVGDGSSQLLPASGVTDEQGTFASVFSSTVAGSKRLSATLGSVVTGARVEADVQVVPAAPAQLTLSASTREAVADGEAAIGFTASARDVFGNPSSGVVELSATGEENAWSITQGPLDAKGELHATLRATWSGPRTVTARLGTLSASVDVRFVRAPVAVLLHQPAAGAELSGCVPITYNLTSPESPTADLQVEYSLDGGPYRPATQAGSSSGQGVKALRTGTAWGGYTFLWNSTADAPGRNAPLRLRVTARAEGAADGWAESEPVLLRNGPRFGEPARMELATQAQLLATGDFDRDGRAELAVVGSDAEGTATLSLVRAGATGLVLLETFALAELPDQLLAVDLDRDGAPELVTASRASPEVSVLELSKDASGSWSSAVTAGFTFDDAVQSLAAADLDRDGRLDLAAALAGKVQVARNNSRLAFGDVAFESLGAFAAVAAPGHLAVVDAERDGDLDLALADRAGGVLLLTNDGAGRLQAAASVQLAPGTERLVAADLDRDGRTDLVAASGEGSLTLLRGDGAGGFTPGDTATGSGALQALVASDLDGDERLDLVALAGDGLRVHADVASGLGAPQLLGPATEAAVDLQVVDLDGDSRPELVAAYGSARQLAVLRNVRALACEPTLETTALWPAGKAPSAVALGDLDRDGRLDAVVTHELGDTVGVYRGNGSGGLLPPVSTAVAVRPLAVAVEDLDEDGWLDVVVVSAGGPAGSSAPGTLTLLRNRRDGTLSLSAVKALGAGARALVVADLDADGRLDLATANEGDLSLSILLGLGGGSFADAQRLPLPTPASGAAPAPYALVAADFSHAAPGLELAVALRQRSSLQLFARDASGQYEALGATSTPSNLPAYLAAGDFDGDGHADLAIGTDNTTSITVFIQPGRGDGTFGLAQRLMLPRAPGALLAQDLDGDGDLDLAVAPHAAQAHQTAPIHVFRNAGDGTFAPSEAVAAAGGAGAMVAGDLDGDGVADLLLTHARLDSLGVARTGASGRFLTPQRHAVSGNLDEVRLVDLNRDGRLDVLAYSATSGGLRVLLNAGEGRFEPARSISTAVSALAVGDVNRDGIPDVVTVSTNTNTAAVWPGDGAGNFTLLTSFSGGQQPSAVAIDDFDRDGKADLLIIPFNGAPALHRGNGNGSFAAPTSLVRSAAFAVEDLETGDWDRDGWADFALVGRSSAPNGALYTGLRNLSPTVNTFSSYQPGGAAGGLSYSLEVGDFDGDGAMELVTANLGNGPGLSLLRPYPDGSFREAQVVTFLDRPGESSLASCDRFGTGRREVLSAVMAERTLHAFWVGVSGLVPSASWASGEDARAITCGDLDGDGRLDVVTAGRDHVTVLRGR